MTSFHSRSNSFPSQSHPVTQTVEDHLCSLRSSQAASTSPISLCENLAGLRDLHEGINDMIEMPSIRQALSHEQGQIWINELLEGSLRLVDLCEFSREVVSLTKDSLQDLESSMRRNYKGEDIKAYVASIKNINKMIKKCIKNLKQNSTVIPDNEFGAMLKETEALDFSVLKSALTFISGENEKSKQRSWSFLSKSKQIRADNIIVKQLKETEMNMEEVEEGLESLFRSLIKTRVSLLNVISL